MSMIKCKDGRNLMVNTQQKIGSNGIRYQEVSICYNYDPVFKAGCTVRGLNFHETDAIKLANLILETTKEPDF